MFDRRWSTQLLASTIADSPVLICVKSVHLRINLHPQITQISADEDHDEIIARTPPFAYPCRPGPSAAGHSFDNLGSSLSHRRRRGSARPEGGFMRTYEVLFILSPQVPEEEATTLSTEFKRI